MRKEANKIWKVCQIISFKNELKEIIQLPLVKEHIELFIQEIESVEKQ